MQEQTPERIIKPLIQRSFPIRDEILEEYVMQINKGERSPQPLPNFKAESLDQVKAWATQGKSFLVAAAVARYKIPDAEAKKILALALENNANYLRSQPMYSRLRAVLDEETRWMENGTKRLRGQEI